MAGRLEVDYPWTSPSANRRLRPCFSEEWASRYFSGALRSPPRDPYCVPVPGTPGRVTPVTDYGPLLWRNYIQRVQLTLAGRRCRLGKRRVYDGQGGEGTGAPDSIPESRPCSDHFSPD